MCFRAIFHCGSSQTGIIKLEWGVEEILWTNSEVRDNLIATGKSKVFVASNGGSRVKLSLWPFCGWIRGPTNAIWARFDLKRKQWVRYFASRTGWLDTYKKNYKIKVSRPPFRRSIENTQNATRAASFQKWLESKRWYLTRGAREKQNWSQILSEKIKVSCH